MIETMKYQPHRFAKLVPEPTKAELEELTDDIKQHGLHNPIILFEGQVLDGRSRQKALAKLGIKDFPTEDFDPKIQGDPLEYVISQNFRRRQLQMTPREKAAYVAEHILPVFEQQAADRKKAGQEAGRKSRGEIGLPSNDGKPGTAGAEEVKPGTGKPARAPSAAQEAARTTGVSAASIERAKRKKKQGTMTAKERDEQERGEALARIEKALGKDAAFFTATQGKGPQVLRKTRPLVQFSKLDKEQMRKVEGLLLSSTMSLKAAIAFDNRKKVTEKSTLKDLFYLAASKGFELFTKVGNWTVEIYREKK